MDADFFMSFCRCPLDVPGRVLKLCENLNAEDACRTKKNPLIEKKFSLECNFKIFRKIPQDTEDASSWIQDVQRIKKSVPQYEYQFTYEEKNIVVYEKAEEYAKNMQN